MTERRRSAVRLKVVIMVVALMMLTGCIGGIGTSTGEVSIFMTASSTYSQQAINEQSVTLLAAGSDGEGIGNYKEIWINITRIRAKVNDSWVTIAEFGDDKGLVNLLDLGYDTHPLGEAVLPAGEISDLRIEVSSHGNRIVYADDTVAELKVPSSEFKLKQKLVIDPDLPTQIVLDVNLNRFVENKEGRVDANPAQAIKIAGLQEYGSLKGSIILPNSELLKGLSLVVEVLNMEEVLLGSFVLENGVLEFELGLLTPGEYKIVVSAYLNTIYIGEIPVVAEVSAGFTPSEIDINLDLNFK